MDLMVVTAIKIILIVGIATAQDLVKCSTSTNCSGSLETKSIESCCSRANNFSGIAFVRSNSTECIPCPAKFGFNQSNFIGYERSDSYSVEVGFLQGSLTNEVSFRAILQSPPVTNTYDVLFENSSVFIINPTNPTAHIFFVLTPDGIAQEFNETFSLRIVDISPALPDGTEMVTEMNGTILDGDEVSFKFRSLEYVAVEGEDEAVKVHISKTPGIKLANSVTLNVGLLPPDEALSVSIIVFGLEESLLVTTQADSDFGYWNSTQVFEADEGTSFISSIEVLIMIRDDLLDEAEEEYFVITYEVADAVNLDFITTGANLSIIKIIDNDVCDIGFNTRGGNRPYMFTEPDIGTWINNTIYLVKKSNCHSDHTLYVGITTVPPSSGASATLDTTTMTNDYNIGTVGIGYEELIFPPDRQNISFNFYLNPDLFFEGNEGFDIVLFPIRFNYFRVSEGRASVVIEDNDNAVVGFEKMEYTTNELSGSVEVCVIVTNPPFGHLLLFDIRLALTLVYGSADDSDVIAQVSLDIIFLKDQGPVRVRKHCVNVSLVNDQLPENTEYFELYLNSYQAQQSSNSKSITSSSGLIISPRNATITIDDDDVRCQDSAIRCFYFNQCLADTYHATSEIECCNNQISQPGASFKCGDEDICHECPIVFGFAEKEVALFERSEPYEIQVGFYWGRIDMLEIQVVLQETESEDNVILMTDNLIFTTENIQTIVLLIRNDQISQEDNETITIILVPSISYILDTATTILEMSVTIQDTDRVNFIFSDYYYNMECNANESQPIELGIVKKPGVSLANNVTFNIAPIFFQSLSVSGYQPYFSSFADSRDLSFPGLLLVFPDDPTDLNVTSKYFYIPVEDDDINEDLSQLFLVVMGVKKAVNPNLITIDPSSTFCDIVDNDPITIGFEKMEYTFVEEYNPFYRFDFTSYFITIVKENNRSSEQVFIVFIDASPSYPYSVNDYSLGIYHASYTTVFFPPGTSFVNFELNIYQDDVFEGIERLELCLRPREDSPKFDVSRQTNCTIVNILDEYSIIMGFSDMKYFANESSHGIDISIELYRPTKTEELNFTVNFVVQVITGTADLSDFDTSLKHGQFLRDDGNNSQRQYIMHFDILDDDFFEETESFMLMLEYDPDSPAISIEISPNMTEVSILDDDGPAIGFISYPKFVKEGTNEVIIEFGIISGRLQTNISVNINAFSRRMSDFCGMNNEVFVIDAQHHSQNYSFCVNPDSEFEVTEQVVVSLSLLEQPNTRISVQQPSELYISIINVDLLSFAFSQSEYTVCRDEGSINLMVSATGSIHRKYAVVLVADTQNRTAFAGIDFNYTSTTLQFSSDYTEVPLVIPILPSDSPGTRSFRVRLSLHSILDGNKTLDITEEDRNNILIRSSVDVFILSNLTTSSEMITSEPITPSGSANAAIVVGSVVAVLGSITVATFFIVLFSLIYLRVMKKKFITERLARRRSTLQLNKVQSSFALKFPKTMIINSCNLKMSETVGQGQYGIVYKGHLSRGYSQGFNEVVAVKTLKGFFDNSLVKSLLEECSKMADFDHPNVLTLTGVCLDGGPVPYIVMPFMFNGSLGSYVIKNKEELCFSSRCEENEKIEQASLKLTDMCFQISKGMEYLASKRVVHRDLALRNCMVDMNFVIKVCDFGLSQTINPSKEYFREEDKALKLPFKWMAPESLDEGVFSTKSDVWSYGVTCWEVFSCGKSPYSGINAADLCGMLHSGYRMDKPLNAACSDMLYNEILRKCWELKPEDRPCFSDLVSLISSLLESTAGYLSFTDASSSNHS